MTAYCFVVDANGNTLTPTKEAKGWYLIRKKRAILLHKFPMVIRLLKEIPEEQRDTTPIRVGIDDGSKHVGIALVQECQTKNKPVFKGVIEQRNDVKKKMDIRRGYRKYRRSHKRYRPKRFDNRASSRRTGRMAPSIKQKRETVLRIVRTLNKWVRINQIFLEDVQIDIRALTESAKLYKWQYQKSNRLDENLRRATLIRDQFTCQMCKQTGCRLEAHHIHPKRLGGSDSIYNLITLCRSCHTSMVTEELTYKGQFYNIIHSKQVDTRDAQHVMQGKMYLRQKLSEIASVTLTTGGETANKRINWEMEKSHSIDALIIAGLEMKPKQCSLKEWVIKPLRRRSTSKVEEVDGFRHRDMVRYTKRNGDTYQAYITALYPEKKQCNMTTLDGKILKRYGVKSLALIWRFQNIYWF